MPRDGRYLEVLGTYDPLKTPAAVTMKQDRVMAWLKEGAQPSVTVQHLLKKTGMLTQLKDVPIQG
jgi:small subunit ribosomal protein S16